MTSEQIEKKADLATDSWLSKQTIGEGLPDFYSAMKATGHHIGYKQGYTDALSDAKEDAIAYARFRLFEGLPPETSESEMYDLYQTSKTK